MKNSGDCTISITFCYREGDISHPWQDIGTEMTLFSRQNGTGRRGRDERHGNVAVELPESTDLTAAEKLKTAIDVSPHRHGKTAAKTDECADVAG